MLIPILTLLFAFASAIGATIAAKDVIFDKGKLNKRGKWFIFFQILIIVLPVLLYLLQSSEDEKKENNRKTEYEISIKRISDNFVESHSQTLSTITDILGSYGYTLDIANKKLIRELDSIKTGQNIPPVLNFISLDEVEVNNFTHKYRITLLSSDAATGFFDLRADIVTSDGTMFTYSPISNNHFNALSKYSKLSKDQPFTSFITVNLPPNYTMVYLWLRGTYKDVEGKKPYNFDFVGFNNSNGNTHSIMSGPTRDKVIEIIKKIGH